MALKKKTGSSNKTSAGAWDMNNPAHNQTWMFLFMTKEIQTSFPDSESVTMPQMAWWNPSATAAVRRIDAEKEAISIYRFFSDAMKRPFEAAFVGSSFAKAIPALADVLVDKKNKIPAIAGKVDEIFRFEGEKAGGGK